MHDKCLLSSPKNMQLGGCLPAQEFRKLSCWHEYHTGDLPRTIGIEAWLICADLSYWWGVSRERKNAFRISDALIHGAQRNIWHKLLSGLKHSLAYWSHWVPWEFHLVQYPEWGYASDSNLYVRWCISIQQLSDMGVFRKLKTEKRGVQIYGVFHVYAV